MRRDARVAAWIAAFLLVPVSAASAATGGATAPASGPPTGGSRPGDPVEAPAPSRRAPVLSAFSLSRAKIFAYGAPVRVSFRIDARVRTVPVTLAFYSGSTLAREVSLGDVPTGATHVRSLRGESLPSGRLTVRVRAPRLRPAAKASASGALANYAHRFPLVGRFTWSGDGGGFGAGRPGHTHQGYDLLAAEGTAVVAPRGGTVTTVANQPGGAGNYVVLSGSGESYDYAFMHLQDGSVRVREGQRVATGTRLGSVGSTGRSSGPHLHFEIWRGAWQAGGAPIDPLPSLRRWLTWSR
jgi:murein DD-endopeptidase MepM/ murein hydrolase activator NlpD